MSEAIVVVVDPDDSVWPSSEIEPDGREHCEYAVTDSKGRIRWRTLASLKAHRMRSEKLGFFVLRMGDPPVEHEVSWTTLRASTVIRAPGLARMHLSVVGGESLPSERWLWLCFQANEPPGLPDGTQCGDGRWSSLFATRYLMKVWSVSVPAAGGSFACFARGKRIGYLTSFGNWDRAAGTFLTPAAKAGALEVEWRAPLPRIQFRLLDLEGKPLSLGNYWSTKSQWNPEWKFIDDHGLIELPVGLGRGGQIDITQRRLDSDYQYRHSIPDYAAVLARVRWGALPRGEVRYLGELRMNPLPLVVAGTVVDEHGQPVPRAQVEVHRGHGEITSDNLARVGTDAKGRFELRRVCDPSWPIQVRASSATGVSGWHGLQHGGTVTVALTSNPLGGIAGKVNCPADIRQDLSVTLVNDDSGLRTFVPLKVGGHFSARGLRPGGYSLKVGLVSSKVFSCDGLVVESHRTVRPPVIQAIPIGERIQRVYVKVVDEQRQPIRDAMVSYFRGPYDKSQTPTTSYGADSNGRGEATLIVPRCNDLRILVSGPCGSEFAEEDWDRFQDSVIEVPEFPLTVTLPGKSSKKR